MEKSWGPIDLVDSNAVSFIVSNLESTYFGRLTHESGGPSRLHSSNIGLKQTLDTKSLLEVLLWTERMTRVGRTSGGWVCVATRSKEEAPRLLTELMLGSVPTNIKRYHQPFSSISLSGVQYTLYRLHPGQYALESMAKGCSTPLQSRALPVCIGHLTMTFEPEALFLGSERHFTVNRVNFDPEAIILDKSIRSWVAQDAFRQDPSWLTTEGYMSNDGDPLNIALGLYAEIMQLRAIVSKDNGKTYDLKQVKDIAEKVVSRAQDYRTKYPQVIDFVVIQVYACVLRELGSGGTNNEFQQRVSSILRRRFAFGPVFAGLLLLASVVLLFVSDSDDGNKVLNPTHYLYAGILLSTLSILGLGLKRHRRSLRNVPTYQVGFELMLDLAANDANLVGSHGYPASVAVRRLSDGFLTTWDSSVGAREAFKLLGRRLKALESLLDKEEYDKGLSFRGFSYAAKQLAKGLSIPLSTIRLHLIGKSVELLSRISSLDPQVLRERYLQASRFVDGRESQSRHSKFVEVMVVVAMMAVFAAVLFPVFIQAKQAAKKTVSMSNMKSLGLSIQLYVNDNNDVFPPGYRAFQNLSESRTVIPARKNGRFLVHWAELVYPYQKNSASYRDPIYGGSGPSGFGITDQYFGGDIAAISYAVNDVIMPAVEPGHGWSQGASLAFDTWLWAGSRTWETGEKPFGLVWNGEIGQGEIIDPANMILLAPISAKSDRLGTITSAKGEKLPRNYRTIAMNRSALDQLGTNSRAIDRALNDCAPNAVGMTPAYCVVAANSSDEILPFVFADSHVSSKRFIKTIVDGKSWSIDGLSRTPVEPRVAR